MWMRLGARYSMVVGLAGACLLLACGSSESGGTGGSGGNGGASGGGGSPGTGGSATGGAGGTATGGSGGASAPADGGPVDAMSSGGAGGQGDSGAGGDTGSVMADTWDSFAKGFFATYCVACHDDDKKGAATRDYHLMANVVREKAAIACGVGTQADWTRRGCTAPPAKQFPVGSGPKPSDEERSRLVRWIDSGTGLTR